MFYLSALKRHSEGHTTPSRKEIWAWFGLFQNTKIKTFDMHIVPKVKMKKQKETNWTSDTKNRRKSLPHSYSLRRHDSVKRTCIPSPGSHQCMRCQQRHTRP